MTAFTIKRRRPSRNAIVLCLSIVGLCQFASSTAHALLCSATGVSINYGTVDPLSGSPTDASGSLAISCAGVPSSTLRMCIELAPGSFTGAGGQRAMASGSSLMLHEVYSNAGRSVVLGSWGSVVAAYAPAPTGYQIDISLNILGNYNGSIPLYGRVFAGQTSLSPGSYFSGGSNIGIRYGLAGVTVGDCPTGLLGLTTTATASFSATVTSKCTVVSTPLNFGVAGTLNQVVDSSSTLTVLCTSGTPYSIALSAGLGAGATTAVRKMTGTGGAVSYALYQDAARTTVWGDANGVDTLSGTGTGTDQDLTVYGRVPIQVTPSPGSYSDTIVVTVTY